MTHVTVRPDISVTRARYADSRAIRHMRHGPLNDRAGRMLGNMMEG